MMKIFIIHGWTYTTEKWEPLMKELSDRGYEPVMLNVPGLSVESDKAWTLEEYVEWLKTELEDVEDPIVIAHSNGGRIAIRYEDRNPGHIKKLFLEDSAGIERQDIKFKAKKTLLKPVAKTLKPIVKGKARKALYKGVGASDYGMADELMQETMRNMLESDKNTPVENVKAETIMIWGTKDPATPIETGKELYNRLQFDKKWYEIDGAEHSPHFSHTEQVADIIEKELKS